MLIYILYYAIILVSYFFLKNHSFTLKKPKFGKEYGEEEILDIKKRNKKGFVCLAIGLLILILGLRTQTMGVDLKVYLPSFEYLNNYSWKDIIQTVSYQNFEKGYIIFNKLVGFIWCDKQFFLFVCALCSLVPVGIMTYKYSSEPLLSILIYMGLPVFLFNFSGLRQAISIGIILLSFEFIEKRKLIEFTLVVLLASTFHSSALVFLIAYPIYRVKMQNKVAYFSVLALPIIYRLRYPLFSIASKLFKKGAIPDNNNAIMMFLVLSVIYLFCILFGNRSNDRINGLTNIYFVACACQAMGGVYSLVIRVGYYFMVSLIMLLPEIVEEMDLEDSEKYQKLIYITLGIAFLCYGLYSIEDSSWAMAYPYKFFWEK